MKSYLLFLLFFSPFTHAQTNDELAKRIEVIASEMTELRKGPSSSNLHLGGYGEIIYANKRSELENGAKNAHATNPKLDATRFVLYVGHDFSSKWKLTGEIEIEHANEIFLEQGTIDYLHSEALNVSTGLMLVPVGLVNLSHEPTTFFGVQRPEVESKIIPSTWREVGVSIGGKIGSTDYKLALIDGLLASAFTNDGVRGGRQKGSAAEARDLAWVGRVDHSFSDALTLGLSYYWGKAGGVQADVEHRLFDFHFNANWSGLVLRGVYTAVELGGIQALNQELGLSGTSGVGSKMNGYYVEAGYNILRSVDDWKLSPFIRYEAYNTQDDVVSGLSKNKSKDRTNITFGVNANPIDNIVFKADYTIGKNEAKTGYDSWNLGVGWLF